MMEQSILKRSSGPMGYEKVWHGGNSASVSRSPPPPSPGKLLWLWTDPVLLKSYICQGMHASVSYLSSQVVSCLEQCQHHLLGSLWWQSDGLLCCSILQSLAQWYLQYYFNNCNIYYMYISAPCCHCPAKWFSNSSLPLFDSPASVSMGSATSSWQQKESM